MIAHVTQHHETQQKRMTEEEEVVASVIKEDVASIQDEASAKAMNTTV